MADVHTADHYASQRAPQHTATALRIPQALHDELRAHGAATYPHECCGILLGTAAPEALTVTAAIPAGNQRTDAAHNRYAIEPIDLLRAQKRARAEGTDIVGFYHSHPDHPAFWSETDLAEAHWYGCAYVITSVDGTGDTPQPHTTNSFLLTGDAEHSKQLQQQPIEVIAPRQP